MKANPEYKDAVWDGVILNFETGEIKPLPPPPPLKVGKHKVSFFKPGVGMVEEEIEIKSSSFSI